MANAAARDEQRYPDKLMTYLKSLEEDPSRPISYIDLVAKWCFSYTEDLGDANETCPCGKRGVRYLMHIVHVESQKTTFVGSKCIKIFKEVLQAVLKVATNLMVRGITGTYKGLSRTKNRKFRFQIRPNHGLVKEIENFRQLFGKKNTPVFYNKYTKHWECMVFGAVFGARRNWNFRDFSEGTKYKLRLQLKCWSASYGEGFSLYIIEATPSE